MGLNKFEILWIILAAVLFISCESKSENTTVPRIKKSFDFNWKFKLGKLEKAKNVDYNDSTWSRVNLPHDWSIEEPFSSRWASSTGYLPGGIGWYRKDFTLPDKYRDKKIFIQFDGVYKNSKVWINGHLLGNRPYGYISFQYDLTPYLNFGDKENVIAVKVDHSDYADSRWYTGSGIYRHVWLKVMNDLHIEHWGNYVTTDEVSEKSAQVKIETQVMNESKNSEECTVINTIVDKNGNIQKKVQKSNNIPANEEYKFFMNTELSNPNLWSSDNPYLYKVITKIKKQDNVIDKKKTDFGVRSFRFDAEEGFFLNGENILLKGTCLHHDLGPLGAALNNSALERRIKQLKEMGTNAIRTSHNPPSPQLLDYCDKYGLLVMDEAFDEWARGKKKWIQGWNVGQAKGMAGKGKYFSLDGYNEHFEEWAVKDLKAMIKRDRNHPSIIAWSIGNEIDYPGDPYSYDKGKPSPEKLVPIAKKLVKTIKSIDTTRPITAALANTPVSNKTGLAQQLDVVGYNYQEKYYEKDHTNYPNRKMMGTENGDSYKAWLAVKNNDFMPSQFLWTGVDYLGEAGRFPNRSSDSGPINLCGFNKPNFYFRKSLWTDKNMVYIATKDPGKKESKLQHHWDWDNMSGEQINVTCYTNCEKVELFVNGDSKGTKSKIIGDSTKPSLQWTIPYQSGKIKAIGKVDGEIIAKHNLKTPSSAQKINLIPENDTIKANGRDLAFIRAKIVDSKGNLVFHASNRINFYIQGQGKIIAVGNGDHSDLQKYQTDYRDAYKGKCLAIIQPTNESGTISLSAHAQNLKGDTLKFHAVDNLGK